MNEVIQVQPRAIFSNKIKDKQCNTTVQKRNMILSISKFLYLIYFKDSYFKFEVYISKTCN